MNADHTNRLRSSIQAAGDSYRSVSVLHLPKVQREPLSWHRCCIRARSQLEACSIVTKCSWSDVPTPTPESESPQLRVSVSLYGDT